MAEAFVSYDGKITVVRQRNAQVAPYGSRRRGASRCCERAPPRMRQDEPCGVCSIAVPRMIIAALVVVACSPQRGPEVEALPEGPAAAPIVVATPTAAPKPVAPVAAPTVRASGELVALAAGVHHTCALRDGQVFCWGINRRGILGVGEPDLGDILQPRPVVGLPRIVEVAADYDFTCALGEDHSVYCWGENDRGQLGIGEVARQSTPTRLAGLAADRLIVDFGRACAGRGRDMFCWGSGELGDGDERRQLVPLEIAALAGIDELALSGGHACTLKAGKVGCWGHNGSGQLGNGEGGCRYEYPPSAHGRRLPPEECKHAARPVEPDGLPPIVELALGGYFSHARDAEGRIWRWGQQGVTMDFGEKLDKYRPHPIDGLPAMVELAAGESHTCARTAAGELWCWGNNSFGQLGHAPVPNGSSEAPAKVEGLPPVRALAPGFYYTCVLAGAGAEVRAWCWGDNSNGQLGDGTGERRHTPVEVRW